MSARYLEDFSPGQKFGSGKLRVERERITSFAAEFDPQPFHLDEQAAENSLFKGLAASGWHTAALTMRLLVESELKPAGGIIGAGFDEFRWPRPVRPGDELHLESEVLEVRASKSRPDQGVIKVRTTTLNQDGEPVQVSVGNLIFSPEIEKRYNFYRMSPAQRSPRPRPAPDERKVLTKAVVRAAKALEINQAKVAATLGVSDPTVSRMFAEKYLLDPERKEWELAALFVRLFRALDSIVASDEKARAWLTSENRALGERPIDLLPRAEGLIRVLLYLDAARGRI